MSHWKLAVTLSPGRHRRLEQVVEELWVFAVKSILLGAPAFADALCSKHTPLSQHQL